MTEVDESIPLVSNSISTNSAVAALAMIHVHVGLKFMYGHVHVHSCTIMYMYVDVDYTCTTIVQLSVRLFHTCQPPKFCYRPVLRSAVVQQRREAAGRPPASSHLPSFLMSTQHSRQPQQPTSPKVHMTCTFMYIIFVYFTYTYTCILSLL